MRRLSEPINSRTVVQSHGASALLKGKAPIAQDLNESADAASPDSLVARRLVLDTERFVRGAPSARPSAGDVEEADFLARRFIESANCLRCRLNYNLLGKEGTCLLVA
jgi:hypothetical protein